MDQTVDKLTAQIEAERERVLDLLDRLRDALTKEHFEVRADSERLTLHPSSRMELDLKARQRDDHESLRLTLRWPKPSAGGLEIRARSTPKAVDEHDGTSALLDATPRDDLYEMARAAEIDGRSTLSAEQLREELKPLAAAPGLWTHAALYRHATEREIPGRSRMSKEELLAALLTDPSNPTR